MRSRVGSLSVRLRWTALLLIATGILSPAAPPSALAGTPGRVESKKRLGVSEKDGGRAKKPNVLLITLDTTRADHIGCYGDSRAETPSLDRLAAEGTLAERVYTVAPLTLPAHASIFTSRYPPSHGVRDNADFRLPESETTLAEHLRRCGWSTSAVVASIVLAGALGVSQGFETYDEPVAPPLAPGSGKRVLYSPIEDRTASEVTDAALRALSRARRPFFLWVHYYDPHYEYAPPAPWLVRFSGRPYDGEIAYMDAEVGRLLESLRKSGLLDTTLVAVVSDHGEGLGDHGEETHGLFLYDATVRVPLILRLPGAVPAGKRFAATVSSVDLVPTLLDLLSLPPLPAAQGKSFARALRGGAASERGPVYSESIYPERLYGWAPLFALRTDGREFIEAPDPEIYDLASDPGEIRNLAPARSDEVASWRRRLASVRGRLGGPNGSAESSIDAEQREKLESLGYLSGGAPGAARRTGADPKRLVASHNALLRARWLVSRGRLDESRSLLDEIVKADPGNPAALALSGTLLFTGGHGDQGLPQLEAAARGAPSVYENQRNLANAYHVAGRLADAARAYRVALAIQPQSGLDHFALGNVLSAMEDAKGAVREYREAIRLGYTPPAARAALGIALAAGGDLSAAESSLEKAVAADPAMAEAWYHLGLLAERMRRERVARERFERALAIEPGDADSLFDHGRICLALGDTNAATRDLERLRQARPGDPRTLYLGAGVRLASGDAEGARAALGTCLSLPNADRRILAMAREALRGLDKTVR